MDVVRNIIAGVLAAIIFGVLVFLANHFFRPPPQVSGLWVFEVTYEKTDKRTYKDMKVSYEVTIVQNEEELHGNGEKYSELLAGKAELTIYDQVDRIPIKIKGHIERKFFEPDKILINIFEKGKNRPSSTIHNLRQNADGTLSGDFNSTIARTSGPVVWRKR